MKATKIKLLLIFLFCITQNINAFVIESVVVSPIDTNDLNIHLKVFHYDTFVFDASNYTINGAVITLDVCYDPGAFTENSELENDFVIPDININTNNYTLIVKIHSYNYLNLCNGTPDDSITVLFQTPIVQSLIFLSSNQFDNLNKSNFTVYPIPFESIITVSSQNQNIQKIDFIDIKGQVLQCFDKDQIQINLDLSNFQTGTYFIKITTDNGVFVRKIIKK